MARGGAKPRDLDYSALGTQGRRTGITLQERERDEDGMEDMDGLFSSPEKSPAKLNGFDERESEDSFGSDVMSIDEGNGPAPADFFQSVKRSSVLPAPGRSPAKYNRGQAARKSPVPRSSPEVAEDSPSSSPSDGKGLNESTRHEASPLTTRSVNAGTNRPGKNSQQNGKSQIVEPNPDVDDFSDEGDENSYAFAPGDDNLDESINAGDETVIPEDDGSDAPEGSPEAEPESPEVAPGPSKAKAPGPSKKPNAAASASKQKPKESGVKSRGRPPKKQQRDDNDEEQTNDRPTKKPKTTTEKARPPRQPLDPELSKVVDNYAQRSGPLKGRSLYILKKEDPEDQSSLHTRSGRVSIRPLAYWKNERCVFGDGEAAEGQRYPMSTIKEVVRAEELEPETSKKGKRVGKKSKSKKAQAESSDEEDDPQPDLWEKEDGQLHGYVPIWDPKTKSLTGDEEMIDIAYAPSGIKTREVKNSTFRFAKLLSAPFIGSGIVELPKDGVKKPKNSKNMHMVFYVTHGRVQVDISGVQFSAGKGCTFQVPRGSYYSFQNPHVKEARLFFTQGCIPSEGELSGNAGSPNGAPESEFEADNEPTAKATKAKGRPKGKGKAKAK